MPTLYDELANKVTPTITIEPRVVHGCASGMSDRALDGATWLGGARVVTYLRRWVGRTMSTNHIAQKAGITSKEAAAVIQSLCTRGMLEAVQVGKYTKWRVMPSISKPKEESE